MRLRILSRGSALARLQARLAADALRSRWPDVEIDLATQASEGDRSGRVALWAAGTTGLFTADLSRALIDGEADAVVHSWKDLPIAGHPGTRVIATLERGDPRDVLLVRRQVVAARPSTITVLSSSPRRAWQIRAAASQLLPWPIEEIRIAPVRGNIPTRLRKLTNGDGDALLVAKAALDRLLAPDLDSPTRAAIRRPLDQCRWAVLPISQCPTAPAQGALAVELATARHDLVDRFQAISHHPTWTAVQEERRILATFGGGCAEAVGATMLWREYGRITSVRASVGGSETAIWSLDGVGPLPPPTTVDRLWPHPDERRAVSRHPLSTAQPANADLWVARAEALPSDWSVTDQSTVWAAGVQTWRRLAERGIWVNGCADGLGDGESPDVDLLAGRRLAWRRLSHDQSGDSAAIATYSVIQQLPVDIETRSHFFWTSGSAFRRALASYPGIRNGWHASGPGRTARAIRQALGDTARHSVWLDYDRWHRHVTS